MWVGEGNAPGHRILSVGTWTGFRAMSIRDRSPNSIAIVRVLLSILAVYSSPALGVGYLAASFSCASAPDDCRSTSALYQDRHTVTAANPDIAEVVDYSYSSPKTTGGDRPGCDLNALRSTNSFRPAPNPAITLVSGHRGDEVQAPEIVICMVQWPVNGYVI